MATLNEDWYAKNEGIAYPLDDSATLADDAGILLPPDLLADLQLHYPDTLCAHAFLAAVAVTANLVTLVFEGADDLDAPSSFIPLAVVALAQPAPVHRVVAVRAQSDGVGGWLVLGQGARDRPGYRGRFGRPRQTVLTARAARPYRGLPVAGLRDHRAAQLLQGVVRLRAEPPLRLSREQRLVAGHNRDVIVLRLDAASAGADTDVFQTLAGPCARRPESNTCGDPVPVEFINTVAPDCDGQVTLHFKGCAFAARIVESCGVAVDCATGVAEICAAPYLPDSEGSLPAETAAVSVPAAPPPPVPPPETGESVSLIGELPYTECFDGHLADGFVVTGGLWDFTASDTIDELTYCSNQSLSGADSISGPKGSYRALSASVENISLWEGFDVSTLGRRVRTALKMLPGPVGARHNGGVVLNRRPHHTVVGQFVHYLVRLDYDVQALQLLRYNGLVYQDLVAVALPGLRLQEWYRLAVGIQPGVGAAVELTITVTGLTDPLTATLGPVAVNNFYPSTGWFGLAADRALTNFSYFRVEADV